MKLTVNNESVYGYTNSKTHNPSLPTVIFVHGSGMDHTVWTLASRHFARHGNNVFAVDLPGHGRSSGQPLSSVEAMAEWLQEVMSEAGIEQAKIVGHSLGSLIALELAAQKPEKITGIAMVGTTLPMPVSDAILNAAQADDHAAFDMLTQWGFSKRHQFGGNRNSGLWMVGNTLRLYERSRPGVLFHDMSACNDYSEGVASAAKVQCPVLLLLGAQDRLTPVRSTKALREALPAADVCILDGAGHTIMVEAPNAMLDALHRLL